MSPTTDDEGIDANKGWLRSHLPWLWVALPLALFLCAGWRGADFGVHWDQGHRVRDIRMAYVEKLLLPDDYNYPSVTFMLTVAASIPEASEYVDFATGTVKFRGGLKRYLNSPEFHLRCRGLFLALSSLVVLWVFAASMVWRKRPLEALLAASLIGGSFEVVYHSRWIAPDAVTMQFGAMCLLALMCAHFGKGKDRWLKLAAIAAGLVTGTKYTGGLFLLPVLVVTWNNARGTWPLVRAALLFGLTFLFTTPGAILEPTKFVGDLLYEMQHYAKGHDGYTVAPGAEHFVKNARYLLMDGPSNQPIISLLISVLGLLGCVGLWRDSKAMASALLVLLGGFLCYISFQSVMFVRNLLLLMPAFALLSARGLGVLLESRVPRNASAGVALLVVAGALFNFGYNFYAAGTVRDPALGARLAEYITKHPEQTIQVSPGALLQLDSEGFERPANLRAEPSSGADYLACRPEELRTRGYWPSNDPGQFEKVLGSLSVNYDYYSTWPAPRIVIIEMGPAYKLAAQHPMRGIQAIFKDLKYVPKPSKPVGKKANRAGQANKKGKRSGPAKKKINRSAPGRRNN